MDTRAQIDAARSDIGEYYKCLSDTWKTFESHPHFNDGQGAFARILELAAAVQEDRDTGFGARHITPMELLDFRENVASKWCLLLMYTLIDIDNEYTLDNELLHSLLADLGRLVGDDAIPADADYHSACDAFRRALAAKTVDWSADFTLCNWSLEVPSQKAQ